MEAINRRLRPLFLSDFFTGLMFWFAVTFPFMHHVGLTTAEMGIYVLVSNIVVLAVEIPSGIMADRWSRKGVTLLGIGALAVGSFLFGRAHDFGGFIVADIAASIFFAVRTGMHEAMIYDSLLEANRRDLYEKQLGKLRAYNTTGLVIGSLVGAAVANYVNFPLPYYMSVVSCLLALLFLGHFDEPQLHRQAEATKLVKHLGTLCLAISRQREMRLLVLTSIFIGIEFNFMMQADPLWPLALGLATVWFGPLNGFLLSSQGVAGLLADRIAKQVDYIQLMSFALLVSAVGLLIHNIWVIVFAEFGLLASATALMIVLSGRIQDRLPSSQRSGVESAISTLSTIAFIGSLLLFSPIAQAQSVFVAAWILVIVALLAAAGIRSSLLAPRAG